MKSGGKEQNAISEIMDALQTGGNQDDLADLVRKYGASFLSGDERARTSALAMFVSDSLAPFAPALQLAALNLYDAGEYILAVIVCVRSLDCVERKLPEYCLISASSLFRLGAADFAEEMLGEVPDDCKFFTPAGTILTKAIVLNERAG